jgi:hypothetical protein
VFVHDFVHIDRPFPVVLDAFANRVAPLLGALVLQAWAADVDAWARLGVARRDIVPSGPVPILLGPSRRRGDAVIFPLSWPWTSARWFPELDADLEIARLDLTRTDLQLMGRHRFPPSVERWSAEESAANRITVAAVRRFLELVAADVTRKCLPLPLGGDSEVSVHLH